MTYSTLMVHLEPGRSNSALLQAALDFARRFDSEVIGFAGCQPMQIYYAEGYRSDVVEQEQKGIDDEHLDFSQERGPSTPRTFCTASTSARRLEPLPRDGMQGFRSTGVLE